MKTLQDFKDELAREMGYINWEGMGKVYIHIEAHKVLFERLEVVSQRYAEYMAIEFYKHKISITNDALDEYYSTEYQNFRQNKQ